MEYRFVNHTVFAENGIRDLKSGGLGKVIIYPFGEEGKIVKCILNLYFGIQEYAIVDNFLSEKYPGIKSLDNLTDADIEGAKVLITSDRPDIWDEIREALYKRVPKSQCVELFPHPGREFGESYHYEGNLAYYYPLLIQAATSIPDLFASKNFPNRREMWEYVLLNEVELDGLFLEFGVYGGSSINYFSTLKPGHIIYGFDSFEGLPEDWTKTSPKGALDRKGEMPEVNSNVWLIKGWFEDTLPCFLGKHPEVCSFIHIDCDIYSSTKTVLEALRDRIVPGTVIQFDEFYNYPEWREHEYKAFQEFIVNTGLKYEYIGYNGTWVQAAVKIV